MPRVDGFEVLDWLHRQPELTRGMLIVVLSQLTDSTALRRAYGQGANSFLMKAPRQEDLNNLISHYGGHWIRTRSGASDRKAQASRLLKSPSRPPERRFALLPKLN